MLSSELTWHVQVWGSLNYFVLNAPLDLDDSIKTLIRIFNEFFHFIVKSDSSN